MVYEYSCTFLLFFIYSVIGYVCEITSVSITNKKIVCSRGYLIGPYIPIFGFGASIVTYYLTQYNKDLFLLFAMGMLLCCTLEYFTSLFMELIFKMRWWDYSDKKYNLNGRICLETGILFGLGSILIIKMINPVIYKIFALLNRNILFIISIILFIIITVDFVLSTLIVINLNINTSKFVNKDATAYIKEEVRKSLLKYRSFNNRLFNAFPLFSKNKRFEKIINIIKKNG